jgi:hypothetical protein
MEGKLTFNFTLVQHHPAHVLDIEQILGLEDFDDLRKDFFLDPNENETIYHELFGDLEFFEVVDSDSFVIFALLGGLRVPRGVDQNGFHILGIVVQVDCLDLLFGFDHHGQPTFNDIGRFFLIYGLLR